VSAPLEVSSGETQAQPEAALQGMRDKAIQGRSLGQIAWMRLKRDKVALIGGGFVLLIVLIAIFAPLIVSLVGYPPNEPHTDYVDANTSTPFGAFGGVSPRFWFGLQPVFGQDIFSRIITGSRVSMLVAFLSTLLSVVLGTIMGVISGYFGGWVDTVISRLMDIFLAFPLLLFAIALAGALPDTAFGLSGNNVRIASMIFIIGFFNWPYIGRIIRGQTLSLREREFVDAARSLGARPGRILFKELLPNLMAPILVYSTLLIPTNILFEAALSFVGAGIRPPDPSWGGMLADATKWFTVMPNYMLFPGVAIFITVLAFNLFGDGLRDALDPKTR
jgi:peptide/nickel transport system permease protein